VCENEETKIGEKEAEVGPFFEARSAFLLVYFADNR